MSGKATSSEVNAYSISNLAEHSFVKLCSDMDNNVITFQLLTVEETLV
jgi:hypothetical protein